MSPGDLFAFATGALRGHRLRSSLSLLGVAVGVASVVVLTSLGEGARLFVVDEFAQLGTNILIIAPGKAETTGGMPVPGGAAHDVTLEDLEALARRVPSVLHVAPLVTGTVSVSTGERRRDVLMIGTTWELAIVRKVRTTSGSYLPKGESGRLPRVVVLGSAIAKDLFPGGDALGSFLKVGQERYRVIGVSAPRGVSLGMRLDEVIHIPARHALKMLNRRGVFRALVMTRTKDDLLGAKDGMQKVLIERHDGVDDVTVLTQDAVVATFSKILAILTAALAGIASISLTVAGIGIMNVMLVSVSERTREIGLLKAIGASPPQVLSLFIVEATLLSAAGGLLGLGTAFGAIRVFRSLYPSFPAQPPVWAVLLAFGLSVAVGVLFGILPARRAARLDPVAALAKV